jgi:hypothetical protein
MPITLPVVLQRFEGKHAIFRTEDGQEIRLDRQLLTSAPDTPSPEAGALYVLQLMPRAMAGLERDALARTILNQLLHDEPSAPNQNQTSG